uniref:Protein quiver n=1 Tax=Parastrongyloides trichosuri TaxID=131310 RepID=A0A0N4ZCB1_PARTI
MKVILFVIQIKFSLSAIKPDPFSPYQRQLNNSPSWNQRAPLTCMTCEKAPGTTFMDGFRISTKLQEPYCNMSPIQCGLDQDVCATIIMHKEDGTYWMGTGCERSHNFQHVDNCENVRTYVRSVRRGMVSESSALQTICICSSEQCNSTSRSQILLFNLPNILLIFLPNILVILFQRYFLIYG